MVDVLNQMIKVNKSYRLKCFSSLASRKLHKMLDIVLTVCLKEALPSISFAHDAFVSACHIPDVPCGQ